jgi:2-polyprenyl-3-methyl-5-hydroxy-6-metoxy-1,4-benzoquinol methylase
MSNWDSEFTARMAELNPLHSKFLADAFSRLSGDNHEELRRYVDYCTKNSLSVGYLADCYNVIVTDTQMEQIFFKRNKRYRHSTFKEVADSVYFDDGYMRRYMHGLALSTFLWPNHLAMRDFFVRSFPKGLAGHYLEVGPGHGYYFTKAASLGSFDSMTGVDISASSVAMTRDLLRYLGLTDSRIRIIEADFLKFEADRPFSCIVMGEVLEHLEQPDQFLSKIAALAGKDTHVYITTAINSPAVDHLYLFRSSEEVETMMRDCGLTVVDKVCLPHAGTTLEEAYERALSVNVAYVARKHLS